MILTKSIVFNQTVFDIRKFKPRYPRLSIIDTVCFYLFDEKCEGGRKVVKTMA